MSKVLFIERRLLSSNFLTVLSVVEALENEELFNTLRAYDQLDLSREVDFRRLISGAFIDDLTFSSLFELTEEEKVQLLKQLKPSLDSLL